VTVPLNITVSGYDGEAEKITHFVPGDPVHQSQHSFGQVSLPPLFKTGMIQMMALIGYLRARCCSSSRVSGQPAVCGCL